MTISTTSIASLTSRWRFARHYLTMVAAMYAGMLVLDPVYAAVAARAGTPTRGSSPWSRPW